MRIACATRIRLGDLPAGEVEVDVDAAGRLLIDTNCSGVIAPGAGAVSAFRPYCTPTFAYGLRAKPSARKPQIADWKSWTSHRTPVGFVVAL